MAIKIITSKKEFLKVVRQYASASWDAGNKERGSWEVTDEGNIRQATVTRLMICRMREKRKDKDKGEFF